MKVPTRSQLNVPALFSHRLICQRSYRLIHSILLASLETVTKRQDDSCDASTDACDARTDHRSSTGLDDVVGVDGRSSVSIVRSGRIAADATVGQRATIGTTTVDIARQRGRAAVRVAVCDVAAAVCAGAALGRQSVDLGIDFVRDCRIFWSSLHRVSINALDACGSVPSPDSAVFAAYCRDGFFCGAALFNPLRAAAFDYSGKHGVLDALEGGRRLSSK